MSKFDDALELFKTEFEKIGVKKVDDDLLRAAAKACGPSLYNRDGSKVSSSDKKELETVKKNFLAKKLGVEGDAADKAIQKVVDTFGSSNSNKYRAMFYYLLAKETKNESKLK